MLLSIRSLTKLFPGTRALDDVDLDIAAGQVHALLGENGAGKSTLIKCLTGAYRRDGGTVMLDGAPIDPRSTLQAQELGIGTVYQEVNLLPNLTVAQNLMFGHEPRRFGLTDTRAMRAQARHTLARYGLDIDVDRDLGRYSVAIQQIVAIARAVRISGKVLILDEPTASLDTAEVRMVFDVLRSLRDQGMAIVFVSHFLDQVFDLADQVTILRNGRRVASQPIAGLDRMTLVEQMLGRALEDVVADPAADAAPAAPILRFQGMGRAGTIQPFDLDMGAGEVVGLAGLLGSGRTETAELLFGIRPAQTGTARDDAGPVDLRTPRAAIAAGFGFAPEDRKTDGIVADLSIRENIILGLQARRGWARPIPRAEQNRLADDYIRQLDIRTSGREKPIGELSGGNQQKAVLARWLAMNPRFLILDEPTRGIDVGAKYEIYSIINDLSAAGKGVVMISSEMPELLGMCDRIYVMNEGRFVGELTADQASQEAIMSLIVRE